MSQIKHHKINILNVNISVVDPALTVNLIENMVVNSHKGYVCVAPVATLVDCQRVVGYRDIVNQATIVTPDGMPVVWLAKLKGALGIERTYGPDLMRLVCNKGQGKDLRHFFYGATSQTLLQLQNRLKFNYPKINIVGTYAPPFRSETGIETKEIIKLINDSGADILWVGLGSPKQDFWMSIHRPLLNVPVLIGAGAAFDFLAEVKPEAPRWMQNAGLGWLFRLYSEPKRLWKRYLIGNSLFIFYVIKDLFSRK